MQRSDSGQSGSLAALVALSCVIWIVPCDYLGITVAMPKLRQALGFSPALLPWLLSGYVLSFGGFLVLAGRLGDWYGRRRMIFLGLAIFCVCSLLTGATGSPGPFIAARVVKGLGSALLSANALASINVLFPEGPARNRAYGISGSIGAIFVVTYLGLTGFLLTASWRYLLWLNVPLTILFFELARRFVPETRGHAPSQRFDFGGALLSVVAFGCFSFAVSSLFRLGLGSPVALGFLAASIVLFAALIHVESRHPSPVLPVRLLKLRNVAGAYVICLFWSAANTNYPMPLFLQDVLHYTSKQASLAMMPTTCLGAVTSLAVAPLLRVISLRRMLIGTLLLESCGIVVYTMLTPASHYLMPLLPAALVTSTGFIMTWMAVRLIAVSGVSRADQGAASGAIFAMQQLGNSVGIPALSAVLNAVALTHGGAGPEARLAGFHSVFYTCLALIAVALTVALWVVRDAMPATSMEGAGRKVGALPRTPPGTGVPGPYLRRE